MVAVEGDQVAVTSLRAEHGSAFGIGTRMPRLSWTLSHTAAAWRQTAYEIEVDARTTGPQRSAESVLAPWPAAPFASRQRRTVRVRVAGERGPWSAWSAPLLIEAGLLDADDWVARFAGVDVPVEATALLRGRFDVASEVGVARARLYVTALGVYEAELNGSVVGDHVLSPGWTSYRHRLRYEVFDVTDLVRPGPNVVGARLADGWYRGRLGGSAPGTIYGDRLALLAQLEVTYDDGRRQVVATDRSWRWKLAPTGRASIYDGEEHDARAEPDAWSAPGFDEAVWSPVLPTPFDLATLVAPVGPPVRRIEEVAAAVVEMSGSGGWIVDFGQNLVGRLRLGVEGPAGTVVTLRHAEILDHGELCTAPLRSARATDRYTLRGGGAEVWEPRFTFHGFRYAEISGWPGDLDLDDVAAVVCHSDLRRTGWFDCSDPGLNRLHENVVWGMRGNFLHVPTDCPQRDERLGWTGDINVFAPTACFLFDVAGFLSSWLVDLAAEQTDDRGVPWVVPNVFGDGWVGTAAWGDAAVAVPWTLYERYGDVDVLRAQYRSMTRWVDWIIQQTDDERHWEGTFQFGDWLDPAAPPGDPSAGRTDPYLVGNAWFCRSLDLVARTADVLGATEDAARYRSIGRAARASFRRRYVGEGARMTSDSQTAYALAIRFGLLDPPDRADAGRRLADLVRDGGHRIGTGFVGTPILCDALCDVDEVDTAYELLLQTEPPSWLYPVLHGATTIWERWDGIRPGGSRNADEMNSFNHYALGAVADWLHRTVAGLAPAAPGYRRIRVQPRPGRHLDHASATHDTPYGRAKVSWRRDGAGVTVGALVPTGVTAEVVLPDGRAQFDVGPGAYEWRLPASGRDTG